MLPPSGGVGNKLPALARGQARQADTPPVHPNFRFKMGERNNYSRIGPVAPTK